MKAEIKQILQDSEMLGDVFLPALGQRVLEKTVVDGMATALPQILGPAGFAASTVYSAMDAAGTFGEWGKPSDLPIFVTPKTSTETSKRAR